jgi:hypothetical protein
MLYCSAVQSSVDEFRSQDFGLKLNWKHLWDQTWCILFCLQNGTLMNHVDKVLYWTAVARLFVESICAGRSLWRRLDLVMGFQSQHTNVGCLAGLSRSQVTWVVNVHADTADM